MCYLPSSKTAIGRASPLTAAGSFAFGVLARVAGSRVPCSPAAPEPGAAFGSPAEHIFHPLPSSESIRNTSNALASWNAAAMTPLFPVRPIPRRYLLNKRVPFVLHQALLAKNELFFQKTFFTANATWRKLTLSLMLSPKSLNTNNVKSSRHFVKGCVKS